MSRALRGQGTLPRVRRPPDGPLSCLPVLIIKWLKSRQRQLFVCGSEASFTATGLHLDINSTWLQSARDCPRLLAAARQQVRLSSRTLCPILLRQIPQDHHSIDARTPLKPRPPACGFLTHGCQCLVCSTLGASAEPTPRWRLLASYAMDADNPGRYPQELITLHTPLSQHFGLRGRGKERSLSARAGCPFGPSLASHRHGSVVQWGCSYDSCSHCPFMGMCWGVVAMLWECFYSMWWSVQVSFQEIRAIHNCPM